jgi:DtxR family Mn-dependent transcriptional regulator
MLGRPSRDPHGDPIPTLKGGGREVTPVRLATLKSGDRGEVLRCLDQDAKFLDHVRRMGLKPGRRFRVSSVAPFGGPISLVIGRRRVQIGPAVASSLEVRELRKAS